MKRIAFLLILLVLAGALGIESWHLRTDYDDLRTAAADLRQSELLLGSPSTWSTASIGQADALRRAASALLEEAQGRLSSDVGLRVAGALPYSSSQTRALDDLVATGIDAVAADGDLVAVARSYIEQAQGAKIGGRLLSIVSSTAAPLSDAEAHLKDAAARLQPDLDAGLADPLMREVRTASDGVQHLLPKVEAATTLAQVLPAAMGATGSRTYLVALPNPAELRPDGGLSAFIGVIRFDGGKLTSLAVNRDAVYRPSDPCFPVPTVLAYYLTFTGNCLDLGDAGWNPDFPTTARLLEAMFKARTGTQVDGVIALDTYAVAGLLDVIGPLSVPGYGSFTSQNLLGRLLTIVNVQLDYGAVSALSATFFSNLLSAPVSRWPATVTALQDTADQRHVQLFMQDATLERLLLPASAGGALLPAGGSDYLLIADANVSPSKADFEIQKSAALNVSIDSAGALSEEVSATYVYPNPVTPSAADRILNTDGVYKDYVRFYVPGGASVTSVDYYLDGHKTAAGVQPFEHQLDRLGIGVFFKLPRGHSGEVRVSYSEPAAKGRRYRVWIQKEPGTLERPIQVRVERAQGRSSYRSDLTTDASYQVIW